MGRILEIGPVNSHYYGAIEIDPDSIATVFGPIPHFPTPIPDLHYPSPDEAGRFRRSNHKALIALAGISGTLAGCVQFGAQAEEARDVSEYDSSPSPENSGIQQEISQQGDQEREAIYDRFDAFFDKYYGNEPFRHVGKEYTDIENGVYSMSSLILMWGEALGIPKEATLDIAIPSKTTLKPSERALEYYEMIPNTKDSLPFKGDIILFLPSDDSYLGDIGIATGDGNVIGGERWEMIFKQEAFMWVDDVNLEEALSYWLRPKGIFDRENPDAQANVATSEPAEPMLEAPFVPDTPEEFGRYYLVDHWIEKFLTGSRGKGNFETGKTEWTTTSGVDLLEIERERIKQSLAKRQTITETITYYQYSSDDSRISNRGDIYEIPMQIMIVELRNLGLESDEYENGGRDSVFGERAEKGIFAGNFRFNTDLRYGMADLIVRGTVEDLRKFEGYDDKGNPLDYFAFDKITEFSPWKNVQNKLDIIAFNTDTGGVIDCYSPDEEGLGLWLENCIDSASNDRANDRFDMRLLSQFGISEQDIYESLGYNGEFDIDLTRGGEVLGASTGLTLNLKFPFDGMWYFTGGPHNFTEKPGVITSKIRPELDFAPPEITSCKNNAGAVAENDWVTASESGEIIALTDPGRIIIKDNNGFDVTYEHIDVKDGLEKGDEVDEGGQIGNPGCFGNTTGIHVDISVSKDGKSIPAKNLIFSGYEVRELPKNYDGTLVKDGKIITADTGRCGPSQESIDACGGIRNDVSNSSENSSAIPEFEPSTSLDAAKYEVAKWVLSYLKTPSIRVNGDSDSNTWYSDLYQDLRISNDEVVRLAQNLAVGEEISGPISYRWDQKGLYQDFGRRQLGDLLFDKLQIDLYDPNPYAPLPTLSPADEANGIIFKGNLTLSGIAKVGIREEQTTMSWIDGQSVGTDTKKIKEWLAKDPDFNSITDYSSWFDIERLFHVTVWRNQDGSLSSDIRCVGMLDIDFERYYGEGVYDSCLSRLDNGYPQEVSGFFEIFPMRFNSETDGYEIVEVDLEP